MRLQERFDAFHDGLSEGLRGLRPLIAAIVVLDLSRRLFTGLIFLTDDGPHPVAAMRAYLTLEGDPPWSLHALGGSATYAGALLLMQMALAILWGCGIRRHLTGALTWLLLASLQQRNELILHAADSLLSIAVMWITLADLENHLRGSKSRNWSALFFFFHVIMIFFATGLSKWNTAWLRGDALYFLVTMGTSMKAWTRSLVEFPVLLKGATWGSLALEVSAPLWALVYVLSRNVRRGLTAVLIAFHVAIFATMNVGNFSPIYISFWLYFAGFLARPAPRVDAQERRGLSALRTFAIVMLATAVAMFLINSAGLTALRYASLESFARISRVARLWRLFTLEQKVVPRMDVYEMVDGAPTHSPLTGANWQTLTAWPLGPTNADLRWMHLLDAIRKPRVRALDGYLGKYLCRNNPTAKMLSLRREYFRHDTPGRLSDEELASWNCEEIRNGETPMSGSTDPQN